MTSKRILVTGAGGFIGYNLANDLAANGWEVKGIDLHFPEDPGEGREARFDKVQADFRETSALANALEGADSVIHLASAHLDVGMRDEEYWDVNVRSLPALLEQARAAGVKRFVHVSSVGVYGKLATCPANEETACHPQSIYGRTKLEGERKVLEFHRETQFPVVVLRPAWVYGPGCPRTMKLYRTLRKGRFVMIGKGGNLRHPIFIDDFVMACKQALEATDAVGEMMIVAGPDVITTHELVEGFSRALGVPFPKIRLPYSLGKLLAVTAETCFGLIGKSPPVSRRTLEFFDTDNAFEIDKAKRALGYRPSFDLDQGLARTRDWLEKGPGRTSG
jgi:nucleoside-diphosphate-sugar epimerase